MASLNDDRISEIRLHLRQAKITLGDVVYDPGGNCGPRIQRDYQLVILHTGSVELFLNSAKLLLKAGQAVLLHPRQPEHFHFSREVSTRHSWCSIHPSAVPRTLREALPAVSEVRRWTPHLQELFDMALLTARTPWSNTPLDEQRLLHISLHLMAEFASESVRQAAPATDERLARMHRLMADKHEMKLDLGDLARAAGLSKQHLLKICRERGLPSPIHQLYLLRLQLAADRLLQTGLSIKEISEQCGFENPFHFSRKFREIYGLSPRQYRMKAQEE